MRKLTIGQKRNERLEERAKAPKTKGAVSPIDKVISDINALLAGQGRVFRGSEIVNRQFRRRSSGIPSIDYVTNGGYPRGGLVEIGGEYSVGKTSCALEACAHEQQTEGGNIGWIALEPFSKRWAREKGFWIPFSENEIMDPETGELKPSDPYEEASELEQIRMAQLGIEDPYALVQAPNGNISQFVLVQEERGDVALDAALVMLRSNRFSIIVVDSLGVAKSTKWLEEQEVQDAGDFPREAKMIGDYTARAVLALNARYDDTGQRAKDGHIMNQTTLIHLNHIGTVIGTQAHAAHKTQRIKGGEGNKHNHHVILFLSKGAQERIEADKSPTKKPYVYAQETRVICLKSKLGPPYMEGVFTYYMQPWGPFQTGDFNKVKDLVQLAIIAGVVDVSGSWVSYGEIKVQGKESFETMLLEDLTTYQQIAEETRLRLLR